MGIDLAELGDSLALLVMPGWALTPQFAAQWRGVMRGRDLALIDSLREAARTSNGVVPGVVDGFGSRYVIDFLASGPKGAALVRSAWIVRAGEDFPRFTSCYVL